MSEATSNAPLTVVLVHGAFADSSSWDGVIERLQAAGIQVTALPNPLRGISYDSAYVASFMKQIPGPVLAVGHSYGGAVISNAATGLGNVVGLVFIAAFAPDEGERLGEVTASSRDSVLGTAQVALQYPTPDGARTEFAIDPAKLHDVFAADLPAQQAAVMAATQRPVSELAFTEPSGPPAWKSLPRSWSTEIVLMRWRSERLSRSSRQTTIRRHPAPALDRQLIDDDLTSSGPKPTPLSLDLDTQGAYMGKRQRSELMDSASPGEWIKHHDGLACEQRPVVVTEEALQQHGQQRIAEACWV